MHDSTHYLIITVGTTGDVHPFLPLAHALQERGRKVTVISNNYHAKLVQDANLPFVGIGSDEEYLRIIANPDLWDPKKGFAALMADYGAQLCQINAAIQSVSAGQRAVVIAHPFAVPGAAIAREQGLVHSVVAAYLAPGNLKSCHDPLTIGASSIPHWVPMGWRRALWRFVEKGWIDPVAVAQINAVRTASGLPQVQSFLSHIAQSPDLSITLFPAWFAPTPPDWPRPLISGDFPLFESGSQPRLSAELGDFLTGGESPVVFTPGTGNLHASYFFACALAAVKDLRCRAIFLTRDRSQVPAQLPSSVVWQSYAPLTTLLPRCAALVHHGGIGTTAEALRAGTPQLVIPFAWDQFDNGSRVSALGVGAVIPAQRLSARKLVRRMRALRDAKSIQTQCANVALRFTRSHDPMALCKAIECALFTQNDGNPTATPLIHTVRD
jgi:rhamnosyltransferase subunit B